MKKRMKINILLAFSFGIIAYFLAPEINYLNFLYEANAIGLDFLNWDQALNLNYFLIFPLKLLSMILLPYNIIIMERRIALLHKFLLFTSILLFWVIVYLLVFDGFIFALRFLRVLAFLFLFIPLSVLVIHFLVDKRDYVAQNSDPEKGFSTNYLYNVKYDRNYNRNRLITTYIAIFLLLPLPGLVYDYFHTFNVWEHLLKLEFQQIFYAYKFQYITLLPLLFSLLVWLPYQYLIKTYACVSFQKVIAFVVIYAIWFCFISLIDPVLKHYSPLEIVLTAAFHTLVFVPLFAFFGVAKSNEQESDRQII